MSLPAAQPSSQSAPAPSKARTFIARLSSTLMLWALLGVGLALKLDWLLLVAIILVGLLGTLEYCRLQRHDIETHPYTWLSLIMGLLYWAAVAWFTLPSRQEPSWLLDAALITLAVQGAFLVAFSKQLDGPNTLLRVFNAIFGIVYTIFLWSFMVRLLFFGGVESGRMLVLMVIMVTKFSDMGAYAVGSWIGKHKMIPHISPGKTWQGFGGAILGCYVGMVGMMLVVPHHLLPLTWTTALILAPILCIVGVVGDLAESVLKRCHQIKDSGHKLPGIGGILDLTDSLIFTGPVAYFYLKFIA